MKYLRKFESSIDNTYYHLINIGEYDDLSFATIDFTESEFNKLDEMFKEYDFYKLTNSGLCFTEDDDSFIFRKMDDEWYLLRKINGGDSQEYKCDQWEGLLKCIDYNLGNHTEIRNESISNETYEEISYDKWADLFIKSMDMSETESDHIAEMVRQYDESNDIDIDFVDKKYLRIKVGTDSIINIGILDDEWYIVDVETNLKSQAITEFMFYRCDQRSGLEDCLDDILGNRHNPTPEYKRSFESLKGDDYYYEITYDEWDQLTEESTKFTQSEFQEIKRHIPNRFIPEMRLIIVNSHNYNFIRIDDDSNVEIDINKTSDEWYLVYDGSSSAGSWYKCDQLEGLLKFISDKWI